ncbi:hypothetical protein HDA40_001965 [Hamadaea flava]|nr:hypothetical protein [Hamadaea flava]
MTAHTCCGAVGRIPMSRGGRSDFRACEADNRWTGLKTKSAGAPRPDRPADARERELRRREQRLAAREAAAHERDRLADERDRKADERDRRADERDRALSRREEAVAEGERALNERRIDTELFADSHNVAKKRTGSNPLSSIPKRVCADCAAPSPIVRLLARVVHAIRIVADRPLLCGTRRPPETQTAESIADRALSATARSRRSSPAAASRLTRPESCHWPWMSRSAA